MVFGMLVFQVNTWHKLIRRALELCPVEHLNSDLLEVPLGLDLGLCRGQQGRLSLLILFSPSSIGGDPTGLALTTKAFKGVNHPLLATR